MEDNETPDQAMARELQEELGLTNIMLTHRDFWLHDNGKLILGFVGTLDETTPLVYQVEEMRGTKWQSVADIVSGKVVVNSYGEFILKNTASNADV
jgi:8-oxo-dGTP pyrophosphatase MutT (NUDIX family)